MPCLAFKWILMSIPILHAKIVSCMLPTAEHVPGNALSTIRAQKSGMTSRNIWRPSVSACLKETLETRLNFASKTVHLDWYLNLGHPRSKIFSPFESPYMTSYLISIDTFSLSRTVFEIFDFKVFRVWPWPLTFGGHLRSKIISTIWKPIYDFLFKSHWHFLSISYRFRDIRLQRFQGLILTFDLQGWP